MDLHDFIKHRSEFVNQVIGRLKAENAHSFSDEELERCLDECAGNITDLAKQLRDAGLLVETQTAYRTGSWPFPTRQREAPNA